MIFHSLFWLILCGHRTTISVDNSGHSRSHSLTLWLSLCASFNNRARISVAENNEDFMVYGLSIPMPCGWDVVNPLKKKHRHRHRHQNRLQLIFCPRRTRHATQIVYNYISAAIWNEHENLSERNELYRTCLTVNAVIIRQRIIIDYVWVAWVAWVSWLGVCACGVASQCVCGCVHAL